MNARRQRGYALIEVLVYVAIVAVLLELSFDAYSRYNNSSRGLRRNVIDMVEVLRAGEHWRDDLRKATALPRFSEQPSGAVFVIPQKEGDIVYSFSGDTIRRGAGEKSALMVSGVKSSVMEKDVRQFVVSWRWEIELMTQQKRGQVRPLFTFESLAPVHE